MYFILFFHSVLGRIYQQLQVITFSESRSVLNERIDYLRLFSTIRHYSRLFNTIRNIRY